MYDREWAAVIRPILAKYFKSGLIGPAHLPYPPARIAVRKQEGEGQRPSLLFDFRSSRDLWPSKLDFSKIRDPFSVDILHLSRRHHDLVGPDARFAPLRIWSDAYF